jgi:N-acetylmuramoyl-L-alanine amidase
MMWTAFVALQLAAASPPLVLRDGQHSVRVPTVASVSGPMVRADALTAMLPITVRHDSASAYTLEVWGARLQLQIGFQVVRVGDAVHPLAAAPAMQGGHLMVPLQLISDVFPVAVPNTRWDAASGQLVVFNVGLAGPPPMRAVAQSGSETSRSHRDTDVDADDAHASRLPPVPVKHHRRTIIVDAGHGGVDNGMTGPLGGRGPKIFEKDITLSVANKLGRQLATRGVDVVYTRTRDTLIALDDRGRIANRAGGNLFISIHVNAANPNWKDPEGARGFETYFLSEARTEDARRVEQMENAAVRFEDATTKIDKDDPLSFILSDMRQNEHLRESSDLAELIQRQLGKMHPGPSRGVKQAGFRVLVTAYMPAVLVEIGFGTNARESAFISDPAKQDAIAAAVADGAMKYLDRYEQRVSGTRAGVGPAPR